MLSQRSGVNACTKQVGTQLDFLTNSWYEDQPGHPGTLAGLQAAHLTIARVDMRESAPAPKAWWATRCTLRTCAGCTVQRPAVRWAGATRWATTGVAVAATA